MTPSVSSEGTELSVRCGHSDDVLNGGNSHGPYGSLQETTVGPDVSMNEFSRELPSTEYHSLSRDLPITGGPSIFSDGPGYDALDRELAQQSSQLSLLQDEGIQKPVQSIEDRSHVVTSMHHSGVRIPGKPNVNRKRILHVAPPVEHDCLVFDKVEQERQRERCADSISKLLHPKTQQLFTDLKGAG